MDVGPGQRAAAALARRDGQIGRQRVEREPAEGGMLGRLAVLRLAGELGRAIDGRDPMFVASPVDHLDEAQEVRIFDDDAEFLVDFPAHGHVEGFERIDFAAGKAPAAGLGFRQPLDEEQLAVAHHRRAATDSRVLGHRPHAPSCRAADWKGEAP